MELMELVIAEKKDLGLDIAKALNPNYEDKKTYFIVNENLYVTWAYGHLLGLKEPEDYDEERYKKWKLEELPIYFPNWELKVKENTKYQFGVVENLLKKASSVVHAGDPDDEGQLLIDEILEYTNYKKPVKRIFVNDNNAEKIKKSYETMTDNKLYKKITEATKGRQICDFIYGCNLTRFFTLKNQAGTLNVGRIKTSLMNMIANRDLEIESHKKQCFFTLKVTSTISRNPDKNLLNEFDNYKKEMFEAFKNKEKVENYLDKLQKMAEEIKDKDIIFDFIPSKENTALEDGFIKNKDYLEAVISESKNVNVLYKVEREVVKENAPLPFNLAGLQSYCSKKFGYSPDKTLEITQALRDKHKAITYNRTDSQYLSDEHFQERYAVIEKIKENLEIKTDDLDLEKKSKAFNSELVTAHHGIIPTITNQNLKNFSEEERNIYIVICNYYLVQFANEKISEKITIQGNFKNGFNDSDMLRATQSIVIDRGFEDTLKEYSNDESEETQIKNDLSWLTKKEYSGTLEKFDIESKETKPKKYYTYDTLLKDMTSIAKYCKDEETKQIMKKKDEGKKGESGSIGTPATRSTIIKELLQFGFIKEEKKYIKTTEKAREFLKVLPDLLKEVDLTAKFYLQQESIKNNEMSLEEMELNNLEIVKEIISKEYETLNYVEKNKSDKEELTKCICGGSIFESEKSYYCSDCKKILTKNNTFYGKLSSSNAKNLFKGKEIIIKNLTSKTNKKYDGTFILDNTQEKFFSLKLQINSDNSSKEKFTDCQCGGEIYENTLAYQCNSCKKSLFKEQKFHGKVSKTNAKKLFKGEEILLEKVTGKFGEYAGFFTLNSSNDKYFGFNFVRKAEIEKK